MAWNLSSSIPLGRSVFNFYHENRERRVISIPRLSSAPPPSWYVNQLGRGVGHLNTPSSAYLLIIAWTIAQNTPKRTFRVSLTRISHSHHPLTLGLFGLLLRLSRRPPCSISLHQSHASRGCFNQPSSTLIILFWLLLSSPLKSTHWVPTSSGTVACTWASLGCLIGSGFLLRQLYKFLPPPPNSSS